ncbi:DUF2490 domain-containing protein [Mucilaginibacter hurinus]|uniref:DUF2490 domain-containing protein n=1 Tax=Mucilaginibacter hurinus TaxID=2201324 RepID=A0A367GNB3_9SPHI|nr:DUF2490 domain-containing protein [Mucilaginibacter hurinus]RCH54982.1 DUF2490 domain-containing protein [Mucilaginibacter hurinus]
MKKIYVLLLVLCLSAGRLAAQSSQQSLWGGLFHTHKLSKHWGYAFDGQFRSADDVKYLRNILLRPSVAYYIDNNHVFNLGYAYIGTNSRDISGSKSFRAESRTFQQFTLTHKVCPGTNLSHRFRLEQRYMGESADGADDNYFSQRFRYFIRAVVPLKKDSVFSKGLFLGLQNEVFVNIQNKDKVNDSFFDQNRAYIALGYRFSKKFDIEAGYMNQFSKTFGGNVTNNILQVALYTRL